MGARGQGHRDSGAEGFRYDALGRRILRRSWSPTTSDLTCRPEVCVDDVMRTIWDGDQVLYEIRRPGKTSELVYNGADYDGPDSGRMPTFFGIVLYTNGLGIDQPLGLLRMGYTEAGTGSHGFPSPFLMVPHYNARGMVDAGTFANGTTVQPSMSPDTLGQVWVDYPAKDMNASRMSYGISTPRSWMGDHLTQQRTESGLLYMRNRYYDPVTGQFTQEDPIGLAGGLNAYGFAGGDPVNHSDPFGLSPDTLSGQEREQLGDLCNQADCSKIQVHRGNDGAAANATRAAVLKLSGNRSVTLGNDIYLSDAADFATLAHETQHVVQYQKWGAGEYLRQGINERVLEWTGRNPYKYSLNGRSLGRYGMEQQGQIVEDCFRGKTGACWAAKLP